MSVLGMSSEKMHLGADRGNFSISVRFACVKSSKEQISFAEFGWNHDSVVPFWDDAFLFNCNCSITLGH